MLSTRKPPNESFNTGPWRSRGYLPHFDVANLPQFITIRLADSLPRAVLLELEAKLPARMTDERRQFIQEHLDRGIGACWLRQPQIATLLEDTLLHWDTRYYSLIAWVIMPNHAHWLMQLLPGITMARALSSVKTYTGRQANALLSRHGEFWMREYFDRSMRDEEHLRRTIEYIHHNPVKAGLCQAASEWPWSSAHAGRLGALPI